VETKMAERKQSNSSIQGESYALKKAGRLKKKK
jgi:hypothetical protein